MNSFSSPPNHPLTYEILLRGAIFQSGDEYNSNLEDIGWRPISNILIGNKLGNDFGRFRRPIKEGIVL